MGSARGDVSIEPDTQKGKVKATFTVTNVTSLTSFLYGVGPELPYPGPMGNWIQTYKWCVEYPCCPGEMPEDEKNSRDMQEILDRTFPYNLPNNFQPTSIHLP